MAARDLFERVAGARAARVELGSRGKLRVTGSDRVRFLNGMVTSDVDKQPPATAAAALLLDRKGRVLADLALLRFESALLLDTAPGRLPGVVEALERLLVADEVELEPLAGWGHFSVEGPGAPERVREAGGRVPPPGGLESVSAASAALVWLGGGQLSDSGVQLLGPEAEVAVLRERLDLPELPEAAREVLRVERFQPRYGVDVSDRNFPAEARLEAAISLDKGCYVGQEIVARIHSRGAVNRLLVKLELERAASPGAEITRAGKPIGQVTSAVVSPTSGPLALGYVRRNAAAPGTELAVDGALARVVEPPLESRGAGSSGA